MAINRALFAQDKDTLVLDPVTISYREESYKETSLIITSLQTDSLQPYGNYTLTDMISRTPGVSMLSTGAAISKPVIRGLYGNRVMVLLSGLRFDNQQWQEEHGLGLSDLGIKRVEIIKGPMSVIYGSEAMGGVINLIEHDKARVGTRESEFSTRLFSNTSGGTMRLGYKANTGKNWIRVCAGIENNADYSDGKNHRILNSRFDGYSLKSDYGFQRKRWTSTNHVMASYNRFGFIFNDVYTFVKPDERQSRNLGTNPTHLVRLLIASSENKIRTGKNSRLYFNAGIQSNQRKENEGGGAISLNMHLITLQYLAKWETEISASSVLVLSHLGSFEDNTNYGFRKIVPNARMQESNFSVYVETHIRKKIILENGIGGGEKWIRTYLTNSVNSAEKEIAPFTRFSPYYNIFSGLSFIPSEAFSMKANISSGVRIPNLAELSSNGLHEGVFTYELGSPELKNEQNVCYNVQAIFSKRSFELVFNPFFNHFLHYVYLAPDTALWFGFPTARYKQGNADLYGGEISTKFNLYKNFQLTVNYSGMIGKMDDGNYLPYIPAQKISPGIYYSVKKNRSQWNFFTNADLIDAQVLTADSEISTPSYWLWNAGISSELKREKIRYEFTLSGNNLLNTAYYDHLSRFKYFGLLNIGRNVALGINLKFNSPTRS